MARAFGLQQAGRGCGMEEGRVRVAGEVGLHARPAALFVAKAAKFQSGIKVNNATRESAWVNGKSILGIQTLGVEKDQEIAIRADGADEHDALCALLGYVKNGFKE
jgi:multiphosphoryl transfer protein